MPIAPTSPPSSRSESRRTVPRAVPPDLSVPNASGTPLSACRSLFCAPMWPGVRRVRPRVRPDLPADAHGRRGRSRCRAVFAPQGTSFLLSEKQAPQKNIVFLHVWGADALRSKRRRAPTQEALAGFACRTPAFADRSRTNGESVTGINYLAVVIPKNNPRRL